MVSSLRGLLCPCMVVSARVPRYPRFVLPSRPRHGPRARLRPHDRYLRRCFQIASTTHQINEEIRDREVRLIGADGAQLGIMSAAEAQRHADDAGMDLVKISPNAVPPVCKLMDYGKFKFEQAKRDKEAKKNQHVVEIKEIRMSPGIDTGDFNVKLRNAQRVIGSKSPSGSAAVKWPTPTLASACCWTSPPSAPKWPPWTRSRNWTDGT